MCGGRTILGVIVAAAGLGFLAGCQDKNPAPHSQAKPSSPLGPEQRPPDAVPERLNDGTLLRQLQSGVEAEKRRALEDLRHMGSYEAAGRPSRLDEPMKPVVATLREMIRDERESLRLEAVEVLGWLSEPANDGTRTLSVRAALPELIAIASDPRQDDQLRAHAIDAMSFLGSEAARPLAGLLFDEATPLQLRLLAAHALAYADRGQLQRAVESRGLHPLVRRAAQEGLCQGQGWECASPQPRPAASPR